MLFLMTISKICRNRFVGKLVEMWEEFSVKKSLIALRPVSVSMLVYIDLASAEKRSALCGRVSCLRSWMTSAEFFV